MYVCHAGGGLLLYYLISAGNICSQSSYMALNVCTTYFYE